MCVCARVSARVSVCARLCVCMPECLCVCMRACVCVCLSVSA